MNTDKSNSKAIATREEHLALVPTNKSVVQLARRFRWKPETAIRRIEAALPSVLEQQIYLSIAPVSGESGLHPESLAKLLRLFLGHQELHLNDVAPGTPGRQKFQSFAEFLGDCLNLLKIVTKEFDNFSLRIEHAGLIVLLYGNEDPERLIEMVDCHLDEICARLDINENLSYGKRMGMCVSIMVKQILPLNKINGSPDLLDLTDFLSMHTTRSHNLRAVFNQEVPDYLSENEGELRRHDSMNLLKKERII